ncbi:MAG: response regulator [Planctomycetes bacterium]|nr:response regulator [Planctomycetota bacterium]
MRIMLVDDSRTIRNIQKKVLAKLGYDDIVEAADGVEALAAYKESPPDLMLVDWNMPNMDGITLVKTIRQMDKTIPMIMCTTEAEKSRVVEALRAGVNNYMVKPFTAETLSEKINQTLSKLGIATT